MTVRVAVFAVTNVAVGEWNLTLMVQLAPGARVAPQVAAEMMKSPELEPLMAALIGPVAAVQWLVTVTFCTVLSPGPNVKKVKADGNTDSLAPVPLKVTGEPFTGTLAVRVTLPAATPGAAGENTMFMVQLPATARVVPHEPPDRVNGAPTTAEIFVAVAPPLLYSVKVWAALVLWTNTLPNDNEVGST